MGTLLDDFFEVDAIIEGIIFYGFDDCILYIQWQRQHLFGATVQGKKKNEGFVAPGS